MTTTDVTLRKAVRQINARAWGIAMGLVLGLGLLVATNVLVIKGGRNVGEHLGLLSAYFPGYSVSVTGSLIGFIYAFVLGYGLGRIIGTVYDKLIEND
jgi:hypothetical protein